MIRLRALRFYGVGRLQSYYSLTMAKKKESMYFELNNIEGDVFNVPEGVTELRVYSCPLFTTAPKGVTDLLVYNCPLCPQSY